MIGGEQSIYFGTYAPFNNLLNSAGNVVVEGNGGYAADNQYALLGTNTITGNLTLEAGANFRIGEYYSSVSGQPMGQYTAAGYYDGSTINFGPNTNVALEGASGTFSDGSSKDALLFLNLSAPAVIGGSLSATAESEVWLHAGTLVVNGANTAANPFVGTLQLDPGTTFEVGNSAHTGAVFGDPNNPNGSSLTIDIQRPQGGAPVTLEGYGTIYGTVTNEGVVVPGGAKGVPGTLTVSQFTQSSTGVLDITVTPTGASRLNVLGNATLGGTLALTIASGNYGNQIIPVVTTGGTLTLAKGFTVTSSGSEAAGLAETSNSIDIVTEKTSSLQVYGHLVQADRDYINAFNDMLYDAQTDTLSGGGAPKTDYGNGLTAWAEPFGQTSTISHAGYGYNDSAAGLTAGVEHRWEAYNAVVGLAASYAGGQLTTDGGMTTANTNAYDVALYGGFDAPNARIEGTLFINGYDASVSRDLGSSGTIGASPGGKTFGVSLQISHGIDHNLFTPYLRATYANIDQSALTEAGTNLLALNVQSVQEGYFTTEAGFKIHPGGVFLKLPFGLRPEITLAAVHDFSQTSGENITGSFANLASSPFTFDWKGDQGTAGTRGPEPEERCHVPPPGVRQDRRRVQHLRPHRRPPARRRLSVLARFRQSGSGLAMRKRASRETSEPLRRLHETGKGSGVASRQSGSGLAMRKRASDKKRLSHSRFMQNREKLVAPRARPTERERVRAAEPPGRALSYDDAVAGTARVDASALRRRRARDSRTISWCGCRVCGGPPRPAFFRSIS